VGEVLHAPHGVKVSAGQRLDSFFTDLRPPPGDWGALADRISPGRALAPFSDIPRESEKSYVRL
jgi:hypothetical protein